MRRAMLFLVPLVLLACDRQPVAPDVTPTLGIADGPAQSGIVTRVADGALVGWFVSDPETQLVLLLGVSAADFCDGAPYTIDEADLQIGRPPSDEGRFVIRVSGPAQATVWARGTACVAPPIATGEVSYRETDNDRMVAGTHNANAWGWMANGPVELTAGGTAQLNAHSRHIYGFGILSRRITLN